MNYKEKDLPISSIELNKGQVAGLPKNPRFIRDERYKALVKSIKDAPEMLHLRELLVYPHGKKYVVIGGNMRLRACKELGMESVPCKILPQDTPVEKLREYTIKDNNGFGQDDWDILANEWDEGELQEWGVETPADWEESEEGAEKLNKGEVEAEVPFTEILGEEHNYIVLFFDNKVDWLQAEGLFDIQPVQGLPTGREGNKEAFGKRYGVGRVVNGAKALEKIRKHYENIN